MSTNATPAKLRNGKWGARVQGADVSIGDTLTIKTRGGKIWDATISDIVWNRDGVTLCETKSSSSDQPAKRQTASRRRSSTCRLPGCSQPAKVNGMCARCSFDEDDW